MKIKAKFIKEGDFLPGLDNGYVFEDPEVSGGYLSYPSAHSGVGVAMPDDTLIISFHDTDGEENYLICNPNMMVEIKPGTEAEGRESVLEDDEDEDDD